MEKEFIPYELALELKNLGFDEPCIDKYDPRFEKLSSNMETWSKEYYPENLMIPAPLYQQAFRWFREKYDLKEQYGVFPHHTLMFNYVMEGGKEEEAELACLEKLIEIVKTKI